MRTSEKRAKRLLAQAEDAKLKLQWEQEFEQKRTDERLKKGFAIFFFGFACILGVLIVIVALLETWSWSRLGIGQIEDCVKVESIQWTEFQGTYSDPYVMFRTKTGKDAKLVLGDNFVSNETLKRLSEASYIKVGCVKVWYRQGKEENLSRSPSDLPFTEFGGLGQWTLLVCLSCFLLAWWFNSDFVTISLGSEPGAVLFFSLLSSILAIGLVIHGLNSRSEWLQRGVGQVRDCVKIEAVEWRGVRRTGKNSVPSAYGLFVTKSGKPVKAYLGEFRVQKSKLQRFAQSEFIGRDCVALWYQPGKEHEVWFSEVKPPFSDMSLWHWLAIWACLFFAGLSWIFFSGRSNARSD
jgi:hypothetical protein